MSDKNSQIGGWLSFLVDGKRSIVMESALLNEYSKDLWQGLYAIYSSKFFEAKIFSRKDFLLIV